MNFHGIAGGVVAKIDGRTLAVEPPEFHGVDPCDRVVIWDANPGTQPPVHPTVIAKDRKNMQLTFADDVGPIETLSEGEPQWTTGIYNVDRGNQRFHVADCNMRDSARFGTLLSSQDGALVNNTYDHCAMSAVKIGTDPWEGLLNRNLLIKGNTMINCGYTSDYFESNDGVITVASYGTPHWTPVDQRFQSSLLFEDNRIHGWESAALYLHGCEDVQITGTHLTDGGNAAFADLLQKFTETWATRNLSISVTSRKRFERSPAEVPCQ